MEEQCSSGRMPRGEESMTCADGPYTVLSRIYDEGEIILKLQQGNTVINGHLSRFDAHDREVFIQSLNKHEREDELPFIYRLIPSCPGRKNPQVFIIVHFYPPTDPYNQSGFSFCIAPACNFAAGCCTI